MTVPFHSLAVAIAFVVIGSACDGTAAEPERVRVTYQVDVLQGPLKLLEIETRTGSGDVRHVRSEERLWRSEAVEVAVGTELRVSARALEVSEETIVRCTIEVVPVDGGDRTTRSEGGFGRCTSAARAGRAG